MRNKLKLIMVVIAELLLRGYHTPRFRVLLSDKTILESFIILNQVQWNPDAYLTFQVRIWLCQSYQTGSCHTLAYFSSSIDLRIFFAITSTNAFFFIKNGTRSWAKNAFKIVKSIRSRPVGIIQWFSIANTSLLWKLDCITVAFSVFKTFCGPISGNSEHWLGKLT